MSDSVAERVNFAPVSRAASVQQWRSAYGAVLGRAFLRFDKDSPRNDLATSEELMLSARDPVTVPLLFVRFCERALGASSGASCRGVVFFVRAVVVGHSCKLGVQSQASN